MGHRQIEMLAQGYRLNHGGIAARHQHLIHRLLLPATHAAEVVNGVSNYLENGSNRLVCSLAPPMAP